MSYADAAAKGPKQSDAEKVPNAVPEIKHDDSSVHSLDSQNTQSPHIQSISSSMTSESPAARETAENAQKLGRDAQEFGSRAEKSSEELASTAQQKADKGYDEGKQKGKEVADAAEKKYDEARQKAGTYAEKAEKKGKEFADYAGEKGRELKGEAKKDGQKARQKGREEYEYAEKNKGNPVFIGNAVVVAAVTGFLGFGAYRKHQLGQLTWQVAGTWAGVVGLFAVGDYYVSQYFFKKYPPKE